MTLLHKALQKTRTVTKHKDGRKWTDEEIEVVVAYYGGQIRHGVMCDLIGIPRQSSSFNSALMEGVRRGVVQINYTGK